MASYIAGLDLGQSQDYTALAIMEKTTGPDPADPRRRATRYAVRHLRRWPLGTSYVAIGRDLKDLLRKPPLPGCLLAVDQTGVGRGVVDLLRTAGLPATLRPITITFGHQTTAEGAGFNVPKKELVSVMQVLLQGRRLLVAPALPEAQVLVKELLAFRVKITAAANETFESARERDHDDLVLAVALACWLGERPTPRPFSASVGGRREWVEEFAAGLRRDLPSRGCRWP